MTIRRAARPRSNFTILANATIDDARLSFKALGILTFLLSKPDHWTINREHLAKTHADGTDSVRSGLRELRDAGYIIDEVQRDDTGRITGKVAVVHDVPQTDDEGESPHGGKPASGDRPQEGARRVVSNEESKDVRSARTEDPPTPHGQLALVDDPSPAARREDPLTLVGFDAFWRVYPLKAGKGAARKAWARAIRRAAAADIIAGAERYRDDPNRDPGYTKYPEGWLNADRWGDDPLPARRPNPAPKRSAMGTTMDSARALMASGAHRQATAPALETGA